MRIVLYLKNLDEEYQVSVYKGVKAQAASLGMDVFCVQGGLLPSAFKIPADAILVLSPVFPIADSSSELLWLKKNAAKVPCISIGLALPEIPSILIDTRESIIKLMDHLVEHHAYRNLLYIGGPAQHPDNKLREQLFLQIIQEKQSCYPDLAGQVRNGGFSESSAIAIVMEYARAYPDRVPDVIVAANDNMAIGAIKAMRLLKNSRWSSCAVCGFDDIPEARLMIPPLTTVSQNLPDLGRRAVQSLFELKSGAAVAPIQKISSSLIIRNSCGCTERNPQGMIDNNSKHLYSADLQKSVQLRTVSTFGQHLSTVRSFHNAVGYLSDFLNENSIQTLYMLLYPQSESPYATSLNLVYARCEQEECVLFEGSETMVMEEFFSQNFGTETGKPFSLCMYPLRSGPDTLGFIVYDADDSLHPLVCSAAVFMANTIKRLRILEQEKEYSRRLEKEVRHRTEVLSQTNRELKAEAAKRLEVEAELLRISELERLRFAQDLHDDICQRLAGISMYAKSIKDTDKLPELSRLIDETLLLTRRYAQDSFPVELENSGLNHALARLCSNFQKYTSCIFTYTWSVPQTVQLDKVQEINVYRIVQEAIHNIVRHSGAEHAAVELSVVEKNVLLSISDNGRGIHKHAKYRMSRDLSEKGKSGIGLKSMEYRAHQLGADYRIASSSKGTRIEIRLPLNAVPIQ